MNVPYFIPWINQNDKKSILKSLNQRWLTGGPLLKKFENDFSKFIGCEYSSGVGSATHALHLAVKSIGISNNDEVIVPTFTFAATANAVLHCGGKPILGDVDSKTFNITPEEIKKKITKKTKAIIVVHYGGQSCEMNEILSIAKNNNLHVIEDCAHSLGSTYFGNKCGNIGDIGCFSFYPTKVITTGEGGMVTTNNTRLFSKIKLLRSQGMTIPAKEREESGQWKYDISLLGYNYRLDEIRSSLGISQLSRIHQINNKRIKIAKIYDKLISKIKGITTPEKFHDRNHVYHLYTIKIEDDYPLTRNELFLNLQKNKIGTSVQYTPLHLMSYMKFLYKNKIGNFPVSNKLQNQVLSLPIFPQMTKKQIEYVIKKLNI